MKLKKRQSKNIEIRKPEQIVHHPDDNWVVLLQRHKENSTKQLKKTNLKERFNESTVLRQPKKLEQIKPDKIDNATQAYYNKPENRLINPMTLKESYKPQRIQVTPGKWNTKGS